MGKIRRLSESGNLTIDGTSVPYFIYRDRRARRMKMQWQYSRGLIVVIPPRRHIRSAREFIRSHPRWIQQQVRRWQKMLSMPDVPVFRPGGHTLIKGRRIPIVSGNENGHISPVFWDGEVIRVTADLNEATLEPEIIRCMKTIARQDLRELVDHYANALDITLNGFSIRDQRTRWGSWSSRGNISLNWRLVMLPEPVIHYVIIHELMHHFHPNHSRVFWESVQRFCPRWQTYRNTLKDYVYLNQLFRLDASGCKARS